MALYLSGTMVQGALERGVNENGFGQMAPEELICRELVELITDYLEGMLSIAERMRFEEHLVTCTGCRNYLGQMRRTVDMLGRLTEDDLALAARDELLELFHNWKYA
jgi:predicted anti-sigma-YlaC factor YlaD